MNTSKFKIIGGNSLKGSIKVSGSKNAALPIIAAALLTDEEVILHNVPNIADIYTMQHILHFLGVETDFFKNTLKIHAKSVANVEIEHELVSKLRGSSLLLAPLLTRNKEARLAFPGGCVLGKRPMDTHLRTLKNFNVKVLNNTELLHLSCNELIGNAFTMTEASVTATENAIMAGVLAKGKTVIRLAAYEPHVQDLCKFLISMGAKIEGVGTHKLKIYGMNKLHGTEYRITPDYLEAGTLVLAAAITQGSVDILDIPPSHLDIFWQKLREVGVNFELGEDMVRVQPSKNLKAIKLQTAIFPSFPTDLQAPFSTLLTQVNGESFIFETLFDGRLQYLYELEKMGLKFKLLNSYQAQIYGPCKLNSANINSCDIRAGAAMVLAAMVASGESIINDVYYIDRGYEKIDEKLNSIGANITRI